MKKVVVIPKTGSPFEVESDGFSEPLDGIITLYAAGRPVATVTVAEVVAIVDGECFAWAKFD